MNSTSLAIIGILAGVINTIGMVPYIRDIFAHKTKPERATWWIWLVLGVIALLALIDAGATWSLALVVAGILAVGLIAVLSLKFGYGTFHRRDIVSLFMAGIGVLLWQLTDQPILALSIVILIDFLGLWLTINKTWQAPHSETLITWIFASVAGALGVIAVGVLDVTKLIYPIYITAANSFMVFLILYRRPNVKLDKKTKNPNNT